MHRLMDSNIVDLETLFGTETSYRIPQFQRPYAWTMERQWEPLWDDVRKVCERLLSANGDTDPLPHFMGAIVLQFRGQATGEVVKTLVVDGQQRLTTLQLLIRASQEALMGINETDRAKRLAKLILNSENFWGGESDNETKIRQSNLNDQKAFQDAIRVAQAEQVPLRSIGKAHQYFKEEVATWLNALPAERAARAMSLEGTLTKHLQLAAIDIDVNEKPHFIFEILNTRGQTLLQSDLIKNTVMYEADVVDDAQRATDLWGMFDSNEWWRQSTKEGRLTRIHLDRFLNYWMVMRAKREISAERVSAEFGDYVRRPVESPPHIEDVAEDIRRAGTVYEDIEHARIPAAETFLRRMKVMELGIVVPPLLWLYTSEVPECRRQRSIRALESFLVRRMLCGLGSQGLNRFFVELLTNLDARGVDVADETIVDHLKRQTIDNRIWPNDDLLRENLVNTPMSGTINRRVMVLEAVEMRLRSDKTEVPPESHLTLEHIVPQSWERNWPLSGPADEEARFARVQAIKEIGNLTLTTNKLNASLSNGPWDEKRKTLGQHTAFRLNWELLDGAPEVWDESSIHKRSEQLVRWITEIWPSSDNLAPL